MLKEPELFSDCLESIVVGIHMELLSKALLSMKWEELWDRDLDDWALCQSAHMVGSWTSTFHPDHLPWPIKTQLGTLHLENINFHTENIADNKVLRIDVQAGSDPCYLAKDKLDHFYIRTGPSTTDLRLSKLFEYLNKRFA